MQSRRIEKFKEDLFYTFEEVGMHFEVYREERRKDCFYISGVLANNYVISYELELMIFYDLRYIKVHIANRDIQCGLNTGELVTQVCDLF